MIDLTKQLKSGRFCIQATQNCVGEFSLRLPLFDQLGRISTTTTVVISSGKSLDLKQDFSDQQIQACQDLQFGLQLKLLRIC